MNKIVSYIGFAIKSNNCIMGQTPIKKTKRAIYLVLCDNLASDNLKDLAKNVCSKHDCPFIITKCPLEDLTNKNNIKIIALTDKNLSDSIIKFKENISID